MNQLKVFEAFAGIGTQTMALKALGIKHEVVGISEIDKYAIKSYEAIHGSVNNFGDISEIDMAVLPDFDLFTYSFPYQDLSVYMCGKAKGFSGERSSLLYECKQIIEEKKPKYLLLENVKALVGKKFKNEFDEWLSFLESLGYTNYWQVLNAKDYGVAQNRERVFVVSIHGEHERYVFPEKQALTVRIKDYLEESVEEKFYMNKPFELTGKANVAAIVTMKGHRSVREAQSPEMICPCLTTMQGGHREPKIIVAAKTKASHDFSARVYDVDGICRTICARDYKGPAEILEYPRIRKLTPLECWRLMGIEDEDFYKAQRLGISNSQLYKQAGNAIVTNVLQAIFKNLFLQENK